MLAFRFSTREGSGARGLLLEADVLEDEDCSGEDEIRSRVLAHDEPEFELSDMIRLGTYSGERSILTFHHGFRKGRSHARRHGHNVHVVLSGRKCRGAPRKHLSAIAKEM